MPRRRFTFRSAILLAVAVVLLAVAITWQVREARRRAAQVDQEKREQQDRDEFDRVRALRWQQTQAEQQGK